MSLATLSPLHIDKSEMQLSVTSFPGRLGYSRVNGDYRLREVENSTRLTRS